MSDLEVQKEPLYTRLDPKVLEAFRVRVAKEYGTKKGNLEIGLTIAIKIFVAQDRISEPQEHTCGYCGHTTFYDKNVLYATCPECGKVDKI